MRRTWSLALRNLRRNRRRSLTTLIAMVTGAVTILVFGGYSRNITYSLQTSYVLRSGHLQIEREGYFLYGSGNPAAYGITDYRRIIDVVERDPVLAPMIRVVTPTISLGGLAGNFAAGVSRTVVGTGVVVADQNRMRQWNDYRLPLKVGPLALTGTAEDTAVIGVGVARVLQLCRQLAVSDCPQQEQPEGEGAGSHAPDDIVSLARQESQSTAPEGKFRIELLAANVHGAPNVASLEVVKADQQGFKELDDMYVGLHLSQAQRLVYGAASPAVTGVVVQLAHTSQIPLARARLEELLATTLKGDLLEIQDFTELNPFYGQAVGMFAAIFGFMAALIGAIVLFTVGNTMSMAVVERTTEIGTLRAMGLRRSGIRRLFVCEALLLGLFGAGVGLAAALGIAWIINQSGLTWLPPGQVDRIPLAVRLWGESLLMAGTAAGLVLVAVLSAWWPARAAGRMVIVDALRHV
ncbi:MAG TPA: FtsX-like permease family protein [Casimicrobiaceae bacterium]|nr:FtsX-like permease family protein [Casimicrobiaceae bacterium]